MCGNQKRIIMTAGLGTSTYAAPETHAVYYSSKVDVYSLGLVYFELLYPIKTEMERIRIFEEFRRSERLPKDFEESCPEESLLIKECVRYNEDERITSVRLMRRLINMFR